MFSAIYRYRGFIIDSVKRDFQSRYQTTPHWMPPAFCEWEYIHLFWKNMIDWVVQR